MNKTEAMALLRSHRNEKGLAHWKTRVKNKNGLKSFGIGLTQLRKLAKTIGRDHQLALKLWKTDNYDAKIVGLLIDEPKQVTREQVEDQVDGLGTLYLAHVFSSCDATLAKVPFVTEIIRDWMRSSDPMRRRCAYGLIYELSKKKSIRGWDDDDFMDCIAHICETIHDESMHIQESMNGALMGIGKRSRALNKAAIAAVKDIGDLGIDYGDDSDCQPLDVMKHLTSDYIKKKLALA